MSAKQCGRAILPKVTLPLSFGEAISRAAECELAIFCYEGEGALSLKKILESKTAAPRSISVVVGSEGGFSEAEAAEAERASIKYKMVEFMADKIGEEFDGQVSGLSEWGVFVELENSIVEGMILMRDIPGDFYQFDEERYEVYGHSTGQVFTIGNKVRIRVKSADLRRRLLDFEFVAKL